MLLKTCLSTLVASCLLFTTITASRLRPDVEIGKRNRPNLKARHKPERNSDSNVTAGFRFYNDHTKKYRVKELPDVPFDVGEMYAGLMPIDMKNASRALYYVFQPTVGEPVDEITIWLNGGPGCSSLEGFFQENGLFIWGWGQYEPILNPYSWVNLTNVLWVEYPVGTGFSIGDVTATSEEEIAQDFLNFFLNFEKIFGISKFRIFVTGESYAGRYVPYISAAMLDKNDKEHFDLSGAIAYDPVIGSFPYSQQEATAVPFIQQNNNVLGLNASFVAQLEALDKSCGYAAYREKYLTYPPPGHQPPLSFDYDADAACDIWGFAYQASYAPNPCFNVYEINLQCPLQADSLGFPTGLVYSYPGQPVYFNRTDVKRAMHAPHDINWAECSGPVFVNGIDSSADSIRTVLPKVIDATQRVLISNGALDMEVLTNGTLLAIQNMTWGGKVGFQTAPSEPIVITLPDLQYQDVFAANGAPGFEDPQGTMGVQHFERGLMWAETYLSGHMQPQFQPRSSYRHLQWVLGRIDAL